MNLNDRVEYWLDVNSYGGIIPERLLASIRLDDNLYCGLVFMFVNPSHPWVTFWERIDDLTHQGFIKISETRARTICDTLPRFLDRLSEVEVARRTAHAVADSHSTE